MVAAIAKAEVQVGSTYKVVNKHGFMNLMREAVWLGYIEEEDEDLMQAYLDEQSRKDLYLVLSFWHKKGDRVRFKLVVNDRGKAVTLTCREEVFHANLTRVAW